MKKIVKKGLINKVSARIFIRPILQLHSLTSRLADILSIELDNGVHPKHRIMKYKEWFFEQIQPGWIVLDIGCNMGLMSEILAKKASFVYGIEIKDTLVQEAKLKRKKSNVEYICADATTFDFSECKKIDCVILSNVFEHIKDRASFLKKLMHNVNWKNTSYKRFLFRVPMINRDWIVPYKKELGLEYRSDKSHFTEYTMEDFEGELALAGLKINNHIIKFGEIWAGAQGNESQDSF